MTWVDEVKQGSRYQAGAAPATVGELNVAQATGQLSGKARRRSFPLTSPETGLRRYTAMRRALIVAQG